MTSMITDEERNHFWLSNLPLGVLDHVASYLYGDDCLAIGELLSTKVMSSERCFWRILRAQKMVRFPVNLTGPCKKGHYIEDHDYFIQISSDRKYARFAYTCFEGFNYFRLTKFRNTDSWKTFTRLYSYSSHVLAYDMPLLLFFDYRSIHEYRYLNKSELKLFRVLRMGKFGQEPLVVSNLADFKRNLNDRFCFGSIEAWIDFSLFVLAGGAVLNSLLVNNFDMTSQDMDFFFLRGSRILFLEAVHRFELLADTQIIDKSFQGALVDFVLSIGNGRNIKIQFIFGREENNSCFLLHTFDLDIVQVAYDGVQVVSTTAFCQAIATRSFISYKFTHNIYDTPSYVDRCLKYNDRGFTLLCPVDFQDGFMQKPLICKKKSLDYAFNDFYFNVDAFDIQTRFLNLELF